MSPTSKLLEEAAVLTLERIRRDRRKAPAQIQPLLRYLETHLFDGGLDAIRLKQACGVRDNTLPLQFHHSVGLPPYAYIEDCRMEVACRLLVNTDLKVWQITQLLGYATLQTFSRAFHRWSGIRPSTYRDDVRRGKEVAKPIRSSLPNLDVDPSSGDSDAGDFGHFVGGIPPGGSSNGGSGSSSSLSILTKAVDGKLAREEADKLAMFLAGLYPDSFSPPPGPRDLGPMG